MKILRAFVLSLAAAATLFAADPLTPDKITVLPGFKVELVKSSEELGSWVAMCADKAGRLIISPQNARQPMLRFTIGANGTPEKITSLKGDKCDFSGGFGSKM